MIIFSIVKNRKGSIKRCLKSALVCPMNSVVVWFLWAAGVPFARHFLVCWMSLSSACLQSRAKKVFLLGEPSLVFARGFYFKKNLMNFRQWNELHLIAYTLFPFSTSTRVALFAVNKNNANFQVELGALA